MNLLEKLGNKATVLQGFKDQRGNLHHLELEGAVASRMTFNGEKNIIWCLNDYLGLMNHPEGIEAAAKATAKYGASYPHSVRLTIGHTSDHDKLEKQLSEFVEREDAMLINLGYQGIFSIVDALTDRHDTIIYDQKVHACLMDGIRLHNGRKFAVKHNSMEHLEVQLQRALKTHNPELGTILVIVDGLYSMHGELSPLDEISKLKEKYGFSLLVDDSHAFGVFGESGKGSPEHFNVEKHVDVYVSTFTKAFGSLGGFVSGDKAIVEYLRYATRSQIFSRTLPLPMVKSIEANLRVFRSEPDRRTKLWQNTRFFHKGLKEIGIDFGNAEGPITPIHIHGTLEEGIKVFKDLRAMKIFSYIVTYPVVEKDKSLIRMVCTSNHTQEDLEETLAALRTVMERYPEVLSKTMLVN